MRKVDLFFNYKYTFRFLLLQSDKKIFSSFQLPNFDKLVCFFPLKEIADLNDVRIYNYCYFFKFFLGLKPFLTRRRDVSTFKKTQFNFNIQIILHRKDIFPVLYFLSNDVLPFMANRGFIMNINFVDKFFLLLYKIDKFNIFLLKKTNLGLLNLHDPLCFKFYINSKNLFSIKKLFYLVKL